MKEHIETIIESALKQLQVTGELTIVPAFIQIDNTKDKQHGDFASNIAMVVAKHANKKPRDVANSIIQHLPPSPYIQKVEVAGPGFINFFLSPAARTEIVGRILTEKENFGRSKIGRGKRILVEFLSSNPTGPLHVGHGRGGAVGSIVSNLLDAIGFKTYREYYVNDAGRQMDILATSIWMRYLTLCEEQIIFPANAYRGEYVLEIAKDIHAKHGNEFKVVAQSIFADLPPDEPQGGDKELYIDALIARTRSLLGEKYKAILDLGLAHILADIREDLLEFGVSYDNWFSERDFVSSDVVDKLLQKLNDSDQVYEKDGALWFRSSNFGDEKDRVLVRANGQRTYFANDVAYHLSKFDRGFDIALDIFGSDHHGYVPRMRAAMQASGINPERLVNMLMQFVTLYRQGKQVQMSTRGGNFVTLRELREEVGNDAARFFYVMRKCEQHMDFDLDLAKSKSNENPVYYVQYAHARICNVMKQLADRQIIWNEENGINHLNLLVEPQEHQLLTTLARYPDMIEKAALQYEPHLLTNFLRDLASDFHAYYNSNQFLVADEGLRDARLALILATRQTLLNGFQLLGISAPETM